MTMRAQALRPRERSKRLAVAGAVLGLGLAFTLAGCGGSDSSASETTTTTASSSAGGSTLQLAADPSGKLEFDKKTLTAPAGEVTIVLTNDSSVPHDVAIEGNGVDVASDTVDNGGTVSVGADLEPGTYTFYCTVPGHEDAGMKGTLTVE